jgi:tetratricopeptide (TPR) repeat protein
VRLLQAYRSTLPPDGIVRVAATGSVAAKAELARMMIAASRPELAETLIESLPADTARPLAALLAAARGAPTEALQAAVAVLKSDETDCDALTAASQASLKLGRTLDALRHGQRAAAECPDRPSGWLANAAAYERRNEPANTERVYRDAIEANPQSLELAEGFGEWLVVQGRIREALAVGRVFTRKSPALLAGWAYYGTLCARAHDDCVAEAERGRSNARTLYGPDQEIGKLPTGGLFGRLTRPAT